MKLIVEQRRPSRADRRRAAERPRVDARGDDQDEAHNRPGAMSERHRSRSSPTYRRRAPFCQPRRSRASALRGRVPKSFRAIIGHFNSPFDESIEP
jgi:hypothetical protein